jgi:NAD+ synthase
MMNSQKVSNHIVEWLKDKLSASNQQGFVIGVSGGIDSAVTSTLCAMTGYPTIVLNMPIHQHSAHVTRSNEHISWLQKNFDNVTSHNIDLTTSFDNLVNVLPENAQQGFSLANTRSRLRMCALYAFANSNNLLVGGTGNKVEDYGVGFFTKYGDGGVDLSPIADLLKSEVYTLAHYLDVPENIQNATPNDGLWDDGRSDEDQIGATYDELEWALNFYDEHENNWVNVSTTSRQNKVMEIYLSRHIGNKHKLEIPPTCEIPKEIKQ